VRRRARPFGAGSANTRLVYSTGGERPDGSEKREPTEKTASSPGIRVRLDRRASGRVVTVVSGLPGPAAETAALARRLKTVCSAGGTFRGDVLELQGDHRVRVEAELRARGLWWKRSGG
jgi:translation initiation factor 1